MNNKEFNTITRTDIGDLLVHWTKEKITQSRTTSAFSILKKMLREGKILGGTGFIKGSYKCVCFTESPISDLVKVFALTKASEEKVRRHKYEPYGIGLKKDWLFERGGRPVIYSSHDDFGLMNEELKWRYMNYNPRGVDFTWEREWRIKIDELDINPGQIVVIVPGRSHAEELVQEFGNEYLILSLSILGLPSNWVD